jgi:hypothetical protein
MRINIFIFFPGSDKLFPLIKKKKKKKKPTWTFFFARFSHAVPLKRLVMVVKGSFFTLTH